MTREARRRRPWLAAAGVVAALLAVVVLAGAGVWLRVEVPVAHPDAILVLASHEAERLPRAFQLAQQHPDASVVLTYPATPTPYNCQDCAHRAARLASWGLPAERIHVMETLVWNSYDELLAATALARRRGWASILVVTSPYHTRRVVGLARAIVGEEGTPVVGVTAAVAEPIWPALWWSRRYDRRYVVYELAALAANGWRYGLWPWDWHVGNRESGSG